MAKVPRAGNVKTRLAPVLSPEQSAEIAACFLRDTIEKVGAAGNRLIIAFSPAAELEYFNDIAPPETVFTEQKGSNLGEKMCGAFRSAFRLQTGAVVMIGTDSPTVPIEFIERAFDCLNDSDAVLGKTEDGGFYLIGLRRLEKEIFENVEWSSEKVFRQTKENVLRLNLKLSEIPEWYDVDAPADLERLKRDRLLKTLAPRTFQWLKTLKYRKAPEKD